MYLRSLFPRGEIMKQIILIMLAVFALLIVAEQSKQAIAGPIASSQPIRYTISRCDTNTISAPGYFAPHLCTGYSEVMFTILTSAINTSVTFRFWGAVKNGLGRFSLDAENDSTVVTANGTIGRSFRFASVVDTVGVQEVSEAGGTAVIATEQTILGTPYK